MPAAYWSVPPPDLAIASADGPHTFYIPVDYAVRPEARPPRGRLLQRVAGPRASYAMILRDCVAHHARFRGIALSSERRDSDVEPYWLNDWFGAFDAISLYTVLGAYNPSRYVEVGSGISTRFARRAVRDLGLQTSITCIDPSPRADIRAVADEVIPSTLESYDLSIFSRLTSGDVIMLDGSHRTFQNSDVVVFFTEIVPNLAPGVVLGIHDVFLPYDYPEVWRGRYYSEQYMLAAYLLGGERARILLPVYFACQTPDLLCILDPVWRDPSLPGLLPGGGMFWFVQE